ncbi:hypothetical protein BD410DRAFT_842916 [Rickenella mellea]|uniref:Uncharacterized protein n=1 Tax=Rickenella mellea TaxID=50990 RepID=A0A4Y7PT04_9AGAM|nr:hypothetical protein BD410DRAFT_842916 [Rickenella mellea]
MDNRSNFGTASERAQRILPCGLGAPGLFRKVRQTTRRSAQTPRFKILSVTAAKGATLRDPRILGDAVTVSLNSVGIDLALLMFLDDQEMCAVENVETLTVRLTTSANWAGVHKKIGVRRKAIGNTEYLAKQMVKMLLDALTRDQRAKEERRGNSDSSE